MEGLILFLKHIVKEDRMQTMPYPGPLQTLIDMCSKSHVDVDPHVFIHENGGIVFVHPPIPDVEDMCPTTCIDMPKDMHRCVNATPYNLTPKSTASGSSSTTHRNVVLHVQTSPLDHTDANNDTALNLEVLEEWVVV